MAKFYIDYENVHNEGLKGVENLTPDDTLYLFYSSKADTLKIDVVQKLMHTQGAIRFTKIENGVENALDFQLITALMCDYSEDDNYYIISRDKGYDAAITMAQNMDRKAIFRCKDINYALKHQNNEAVDESDQDVIAEFDTNEDDAALASVDEPADLNAEISAANAEIASEESDATDISEDEKTKRAYQSVCTKILNTIKINHKIPINYREAEYVYNALQESSTKMEFYHMLNKLMGRNDGGELYKKIKTVYKPLRGIYKASVTAAESTDMEAEKLRQDSHMGKPREINLEGVDCERTMVEIVMEALSEEAFAGEDVEAEAAAIVAAVKSESDPQEQKGKTIKASRPVNKEDNSGRQDKSDKDKEKNNRRKPGRPRKHNSSYQRRDKRVVKKKTPETDTKTEG
ncbi:MAG: hypothetical protein K6C05_09245 [Anaerovibrio sp.]|uniref:PIN domain-containing protein n=1 Tax=Anaerovibrio sp. TaxID=1872532 RepID=UPI0025DE9A1F|nr:PIN domain-containing protein [Anaerovibrio sp.]MCR5177018.1 hypothetical protein [Anaerovibrio sp.]